MNPSYPHFFKAATDHPPYDWQGRLANGDGYRSNDCTTHVGTPCQSRLIDIPTGLGKTDAVVLAWLWNRVFLEKQDWPRRLVYCLPMRTLVEQTANKVGDWLDKVAQAASLCSDDKNRQAACSTFKRPRVVILMGGEDLDPEKRDWDLHPEKPAILIGTQDMLLSRALNRGYGMSRYRWPMHFGLLNNDCLWVMDEVQLMGVGASTTAQLEAMRTNLETIGMTKSWWMSATVHPDWLRTVDFDPAALSTPLELQPKEEAGIAKLLGASKPVERLDSTAETPKELAKRIVSESAEASGLTLVVLNTVKRAAALHEALARTLPKDASPPLLLHSHFREPERQSKLTEILAAEDQPRIVVSTQVVEAGVDLSAQLLFTELAPWPSLVQRFGRCNRRGTDNTARIFWIDLDEDKSAPPYKPQHLARARQRLHTIEDGATNALLRQPLTPEDRDPPRHVLRRKDLLELFDTTPDLSGNDIDIDRFVRDMDRSNVHFFWREWDGKAPPADLSRPAREELCPAGIGEAGDLLKRLQKEGRYAWIWDFVEKQWTTFDPYRIYPGVTLLVHAAHGGYEPTGGFDPKATKPVTPVPIDKPPPPPDANEDDRASASNTWQSIAQHTDAVCAELTQILHDLDSPFPPEISETLATAARWHDWGKAHPGFQSRIKEERNSEKTTAINEEPVAKAPADAWKRAPKYPPRDSAAKSTPRRHFRHELASALAILNPETSLQLPAACRDLAAYLIAAHHGKVRLAIRSLPDEWQPEDDRRFARGVWDNDVLPGASLGQGIVAPETRLSLEPMEFGLGETAPFTGLPSWTDRMLALLDGFGPFQLAFLETLLRAADIRASMKSSSDEPQTITREDPADYPSSSSLTPEQRKLAQKIAAEGLAIQDRFRPEPLYKKTGKGHYESRTVEDIQKARRKKEESE